MVLTGRNFIGGEMSAAGSATFQAFDPKRGVDFQPRFHEATKAEIDQALRAANVAFDDYGARDAAERALFLDAIADAIISLGDELIERASAETALPHERLIGERTRTANQLRMFAELLREGFWVEASIDRAIPDRKPLPKPDLRRMLIPLGPVAVFGASNFPLAFSVAGGDTASALAAGNPVVVKAHPAHPGTSELVAQAILTASRTAGMPAGVFSMIHGAGHHVGLALVEHPLTQAVAFTGSLRGGRALFDAAARRSHPIPVYSEMGSINPVFVLPGALKERTRAIAEGLKQSVTLSVGQFCTCPGLVVGLEGAEFESIAEELMELFRNTPPGTMLQTGILHSYEQRLAELGQIPYVEVTHSKEPAAQAETQAVAAVLSTNAATFLEHPTLREEVFGPATILVRCSTPDELMEVARRLEGHLTATIHAAADDLVEFKSLVSVLTSKAGRLIFNGFPTGVEVCPSMVHGGPYPATTDARSTSVGTTAIKRFARPICYQDFPQDLLPVELRDDNPRDIWRLVDGKWAC
jgi:alpha-ketoglutaric semialdehyde dehydrogenase